MFLEPADYTGNAGPADHPNEPLTLTITSSHIRLRCPSGYRSISNGFDAAFNLREPLVEGSLSLAKRCADVGMKSLFPSSAKAFAIFGAHVFRDALAGGKRT